MRNRKKNTMQKTVISIKVMNNKELKCQQTKQPKYKELLLPLTSFECSPMQSHAFFKTQLLDSGYGRKQLYKRQNEQLHD